MPVKKRQQEAMATRFKQGYTTLHSRKASDVQNFKLWNQRKQG